MTILFAGFILSAVPSFASPDEEFLDKLEYDSILYFVRENNPANGLIKDSSRPGSPASVASVGFGLTAICIGESRGWIVKKDAYDIVLKTLKTFRDTVPNEKGFFYHFLDMRTAQRAWNSEVSSIDTALFLAGALFAGEYFKGTEIEDVARELYERVEWPWMLNGKKVLCMGWKPEEGFLWYYWDSYSEAMILYALAIGSPTHPIPAECWFEWARPVDSYGDYSIVYCSTGSIFTYQYSHAWIDFRQIFDGDINYYNNSVNAVKANRQFCFDNAASHKSYSENSWGLSACLGPDGYKGYGAKPGAALNDGTIPPYGMAGSIVFDPIASLGGLKNLYTNHNFLYGKYGFKDAFNTDKGWWAEEYLGIDVGICAVMIENYRSGLVWSSFMELPAIKNWVSKCFYKVRSRVSVCPISQSR
ncbi:MAG: glucoamylase family protein [Candidatus Omnitrophota bacterium]|nr:glucoamylase family protein [Candidatus Omnitrophota bacterium]